MRATPHLVPLIAIVGAFACARPKAGAQTPVHWTLAAPASAAIAPGAATDLKLTASIEDGWHIYAINQGPGGPVATRITVPSGQPFTMDGAVKVKPAPHAEFDESFGIKVLMHEDRAEFLIPVKGTAALKSGRDTLHVDARYQACNASLCLPPQTAKLTVPVRTQGGK